MLIRKFLQVKEVKDQGIVRAVIATLNLIDKDGDVTLPGFFGQQEVVILPTHNWSHIPLGKGVVSEEGGQAFVNAKFNLESQAGQEWFKALKFDFENGKPLQEWSYGFHILDGGSAPGTMDGINVRFLKPKSDGSPGSKIHEVSPVLVGAGEGTHTVDVKTAKGAVAPHNTGTVDRAWDGPEAIKRTRSEESAAYYRKIFAWQDADGEIGSKGTWKMPHHEVGSAGEPGPANVRALVAGIAVLNGARGGVNIPDADRQAVYRHLAAHLEDAGVDAAPLKAAEQSGGLKFCDEADAALDAVNGLIERAKSLADLRAKQERGISPANVERLKSIRDGLSVTAKAISELLTQGEAGKAALKEYARFLKQNQGNK